MINQSFAGAFGDTRRLQPVVAMFSRPCVFNAVEVMPRGGKLSAISELRRTKKHVRVEIKETGYDIHVQISQGLFRGNDPF